MRKQATQSDPPPLHTPPRPAPKASTIRARESSDRSPSALLATRIPAPSEQTALCCLKCAIDDLLDVQCREMSEDQEGRGASASVVAFDGKGGWGIAATIPSKATVSTLDVTLSSKKVDLPLQALVNVPRDETCNRIVL